MAKIHKGDEVVVITGKDAGKRGLVLSVLSTGRVVVEGVNKAKKHVRPNPVKNEVGGIVEREMSLHISNVALYNGVTQKGGKVGYKNLEDGRKVRFFKSTGDVVDA